jgi:hypothetical protein
MTDTISRREYDRLARWLYRTGGPIALSDAAIQVLRRRLVLRRRAFVACLALDATVVTLLAISFAGHDTLDDPAQARALFVREVSLVAVAFAAHLIATQVCLRSDRRLAALYPRRVTHTAALPLTSLYGRVRLAWLAVTILADAVLAATLITEGNGWLTRAFLIPLAGAVTLAGSATAVAHRRASVAVDGESLEIDDRLRANDAYTAAQPLALAITMFPVLLLPVNSRVGALWAIAMVAVYGLKSWADVAAPHRGSRNLAGVAR